MTVIPLQPGVLPAQGLLISIIPVSACEPCWPPWYCLHARPCLGREGGRAGAVVCDGLSWQALVSPARCCGQGHSGQTFTWWCWEQASMYHWLLCTTSFYVPSRYPVISPTCHFATLWSHFAHRSFRPHRGVISPTPWSHFAHTVNSFRPHCGGIVR